MAVKTAYLQGAAFAETEEPNYDTMINKAGVMFASQNGDPVSFGHTMPLVT